MHIKVMQSKTGLYIGIFLSITLCNYYALKSQEKELKTYKNY